MVAVRKLIAVLALAVAVALQAAAPSPANTASARCTAFAVLKPGNEVRPPDTTDPVESRARGAALVRINGTRLSFTVVIFNPARETFTAGHIHIGARGVNGPVVVPLFAGSSSRLIFTQSDTLEIRADNAAAICANPAGFYVNYHTTQAGSESTPPPSGLCYTRARARIRRTAKSARCARNSANPHIAGLSVCDEVTLMAGSA